MAAVPLEEFAAQLMAAAGSPDRIAAAAATLIENPIAVGPLRVGPGGIGKANAICYLGEITGRAGTREGWDIVLEVPARVGAGVRVTAQRFKFAMEVNIQVRVKLTPTRGFTITAEIDEIHPDDVTTKIDAQHLPAKLVALGYNIEAEVIEKVIEHANQLIESPEIVKARQVNVAEILDRAWQLGAVLPHPAHTLRIPDSFEPPEVPDDSDEPDESHLAQPSHTLPLELPRKTPRTP